MSEPQYYEIPIPADLSKVRSIHDGTRWLRGVIPGSVELDNGILTFVVRWNGSRRKIVVSTEHVAGYETDDE